MRISEIPIPTLATPLGLARRVGVSRAVVIRLLAVGKLRPAAHIAQGDALQPLLKVEDADIVFRNLEKPRIK